MLLKNMFQFLGMSKTGEGRERGKQPSDAGAGLVPSCPSTEPPVTTMGQDKQDPCNVT